MKRNYNIVHFGKENERAILRECEGTAEWLGSPLVRTKHKQHARRFLHQQDCESALSVIKFKWDLKTEEEYTEEKINEWKEKTSRGELSASSWR